LVKEKHRSKCSDDAGHVELFMEVNSETKSTAHRKWDCVVVLHDLCRLCSGQVDKLVKLIMGRGGAEGIIITSSNEQD
jgi:hypothetical protein